MRIDNTFVIIRYITLGSKHIGANTLRYKINLYDNITPSLKEYSQYIKRNKNLSVTS